MIVIEEWIAGAISVIANVNLPGKLKVECNQSAGKSHKY